MGYYTDFKLTIHNSDEDVIESIEEQLEEVSTYPWDDLCLYEAKWYAWETDMKIISKNFPGVLFKLSGEGEEAGDMWEAYFKDGKMQLCKAVIAFEPFDESKLK